MLTKNKRDFFSPKTSPFLRFWRKMEINSRIHSLIVKLFNFYAANFLQKNHILLHHRVKSFFSESPWHVFKNGHF
jgi:hypothetical protein